MKKVMIKNLNPSTFNNFFGYGISTNELILIPNQNICSQFKNKLKH